MRKLFKQVYLSTFMKTITLSKKEYLRLKKKADANEMLLKDIARGIKDIAEGKFKEV